MALVEDGRVDYYDDCDPAPWPEPTTAPHREANLAFGTSTMRPMKPMIAFSTVQPTLTLEEFLALSETKPYAEYLDGNVEPKPMLQGEHSILQIRLGTTIHQVALPQKQAHAFT